MARWFLLPSTIASVPTHMQSMTTSINRYEHSKKMMDCSFSRHSSGFSMGLYCYRELIQYDHFLVWLCKLYQLPFYINHSIPGDTITVDIIFYSFSYRYTTLVC